MKKEKWSVILSMAIVIVFLSVSFGVKPIDVSAKTIKCNSLTMTEECKMGIEYPLSINGVNHKITWKSSNSKVASVDEKGIVKSKKPGKVIITGTSKGTKYKCNVTVKKTNKLTVKSKSKKEIQKIAKKAANYLNNENYFTIKVKTKSLSNARKTLKQISKEITKSNEWKVTSQFYVVQKLKKSYITFITPDIGKRYKLAQKYVKKSYEMFIAEWKDEVESYQRGEVSYEEDPNKEWERNFKCKVDTPYSELSEESRLMFAQTHKYFVADTMMEYGKINIFKKYGKFAFCQNSLTKNKWVLGLKFELKYLLDSSTVKSVNNAYEMLLKKKASGVCGNFTQAQWMIDEDLNMQSWPVTGPNIVHAWCIIKVKDKNNKNVYYLSDNGYVSKLNSEKNLKTGNIGNYVPSTKEAMGKAYPF